MADLILGYKRGPRVLQVVPVDASSASISVGDMLTMGTAGFFQKATAGDIAYCVADEDLTVPSGGTDGDLSIRADFSNEAVYRYRPDAGSVTAALRMKTCDVGGAQSVNIDASANDCLQVVNVDTVNNLLDVRLVRILAGVA